MNRWLLCAVAVAASAASGAAFADPPSQWSGVYAGINLGYGGDAFRYDVAGQVASSSPGSFDVPFSQSSGGFVGGAQIGVNFPVGSRWIVGGEADIDGSSIQATNQASFNVVTTNPAPTGLTGTAIAATGSQTTVGQGQIGSQIDALGTVRLRVGYPIFGGRFMPYATAGLAYGWINSSASYSYSSPQASPPSGSGRFSAGMVQVGWTAGAGADYALTDRLSFRAEYLYADLGTLSVSTSKPIQLGDGETLTGHASRGADAHIFRMGLNYRFW